MNEEEQNYVNDLQEAYKLQQQQSNTPPLTIQQQGSEALKSQLDLVEELELLENLLCGRKKVRDKETGEHSWVDGKSEEKILTDSGVDLVMNTIRFYLNKNTLLSNFDEATIFQKMEDFSISLSDALFMGYEKYFYYPSNEECQEVYMDRLKKKKEQLIFEKTLKGIQMTDEVEKEIENDLLLECQDRILEDILKIKEQLIKDKLKNYDLLLRVVQDAVHSTYMRAWKGQERLTLRQNWSINESRGLSVPQSNDERKGFFSMFRRNKN